MIDGVVRPVPLESHTTPAEVEPSPSDAFGQEGILQYLWPTVCRASLLLAAVLSVVWMRSHQVNDVFVKFTGSNRIQVASLYGRIGVIYSPSQISLSPWAFDTMSLPGIDPWQDSASVLLGVQFTRGQELGPGSQRLRIRYRNVVGLLLVCPAIYVVQRRRKKQMQ
jgi:hypothetical protein